MASLAYKFGLLRGLMSEERAYVGPYYVHVDITHRCNLKCLACRWHSPLIESRRDKTIRQDMSYDMFVQLCDELQAMGTTAIYFVGTGEPMLHPRIFDLMGAAKERGFELTAYTNGLALTETNIRKLMDVGLDVLRVSIWSPDPRKFAAQVEGASSDTFQRIVDGMALLGRLKTEQGSPYPLLEVCQSITQHDVEDLDNIIPFARQTGCDRLCFSPMVDFDDRELRRFVPDAAETEQLCDSLERIQGQLAQMSIANNIDTMLLHYAWGGKMWRAVPCYPAWYFSYFRADGKVFVCQRNTKDTIPVGDLNDNSFEEIWNNDAYSEFRGQAITCEGLAAVEGYFCELCSHSMNTARVHRRLRMLEPVQWLHRAIT